MKLTIDSVVLEIFVVCLVIPVQGEPARGEQEANNIFLSCMQNEEYKKEAETLLSKLNEENFNALCQDMRFAFGSTNNEYEGFRIGGLFNVIVGNHNERLENGAIVCRCNVDNEEVPLFFLYPLIEEGEFVIMKANNSVEHEIRTSVSYVKKVDNLALVKYLVIIEQPVRYQEEAEYVFMQCMNNEATKKKTETILSNLKEENYDALCQDMKSTFRPMRPMRSLYKGERICPPFRIIIGDYAKKVVNGAIKCECDDRDEYVQQFFLYPMIEMGEFVIMVHDEHQKHITRIQYIKRVNDLHLVTENVVVN